MSLNSELSRSHVSGWRYAVLVAAALAPLIGLLTVGPIPQPPAYHIFADSRMLLGIPNFADVVSNLPFLVVGMLGISVCLSRDVGPAHDAWGVLFLGVALVTLGSTYYHLDPNSESLVWDRLPMTIGFMGLTAAMLGEFVDPRVGARLLLPLVALGIGSVVYWKWFDDLRFYIWIQFAALLLVLLIVLLFRSEYTLRWLLLVALGWYILAKAAELLDGRVFAAAGEIVSGHTLKHLFAAAGCFTILVMLTKRSDRQPIAGNQQPATSNR